jgi:hypothetical protein
MMPMTFPKQQTLYDIYWYQSVHIIIYYVYTLGENVH